MSPAILKVNMLGGFSISGPKGSFDDDSNRSRKIWLLLSYLIVHRGRPVAQRELIDMLWHDEEITDPSNALKALIHRLRLMLETLGDWPGKKMVVYRGDSYFWNADLPVEYDTELFSLRCSRAAAQGISNEERLQRCEEAMELYCGPFMPKYENETWTTPLREQYHDMYRENVLRMVELLRPKENYREIVRICNTARTFDPYDEELYYQTIHSLIQLGMQQSALNLYRRMTSLFLEHSGQAPSERVTELCRNITEVSHSTERDLVKISEQLREKEQISGAYYCKYDLFREIYRLLARTISHTAQPIHLCLFTVANQRGEIPTAGILSGAMERLASVIHVSLCSGDVYTRYSPSQFLLLLPSATEQSGEQIAERILNRFWQGQNQHDLVISYKLYPIMPAHTVAPDEDQSELAVAAP
ncbi:BTAD domain-containing putative transcriptional regulator [Feifania hominis]|uniref:BTAD domain-containing putative transcriptional regulator n=1 Tax=Feifania hominis TaxID=2763660 RepID=UPI00201639DA|nr:BTAD domain-containing putative transcriptional regulator [Feifania hominis]